MGVIFAVRSLYGGNGDAVLQLCGEALAVARKRGRASDRDQIAIQTSLLDAQRSRCGAVNWETAWCNAIELGYTDAEFAAADFDCSLCPKFAGCLLEGRIDPERFKETP